MKPEVIAISGTDVDERFPLIAPGVRFGRVFGGHIAETRRARDGQRPDWCATPMIAKQRGGAGADPRVFPRAPATHPEACPTSR